VQAHQPPVKGHRQQPDSQRQDKKKADEAAMKVRNRIETMRLVIGGRCLSVDRVQKGCGSLVGLMDSGQYGFY
jgi:hypothetical protein